MPKGLACRMCKAQETHNLTRICTACINTGYQAPPKRETVRSRQKKRREQPEQYHPVRIYSILF
jgi:hypothetical protein